MMQKVHKSFCNCNSFVIWLSRLSSQPEQTLNFKSCHKILLRNHDIDNIKICQVVLWIFWVSFKLVYCSIVFGTHLVPKFSWAAETCFHHCFDLSIWSDHSCMDCFHPKTYTKAMSLKTLILGFIRLEQSSIKFKCKRNYSPGRFDSNLREVLGRSGGKFNYQICGRSAWTIRP